MVKDHVEKTMKKAIRTYAETSGVDANNISFFIHTKPTTEDPTLLPQYFYTVNGTPVTEEDGSLKNLRFTQDILGKKFDLLGTEIMAAQFLSNFFKNKSEEHEINPRQLYVMIATSDKEARDLIIALYNGSEVLKTLKLEEIFGE